MLGSFIDMMNNSNIFGICTGINPYETFFMSVTIQIELQIWIIEKKNILAKVQNIQNGNEQSKNSHW